MAPDYYTQPANIMPGLQMLGRGLERRERREEKRAGFERERVATAKTEALRKRAVNVFQSGDSDAMARFVGENKEAKKVFDDMLGAKKEMLLEESKRWLIDNEDPEAIAMQKAEEKQASGELEQDDVDDVKAIMTDREGERKKREMILAIYDKPAWEAYQKSKGGEVVDSELKIGAQEILEDGTIIQSTPKGPVVYNPEGKKVTGKDAAGAVAMARAEKVKNERLKAGEKRRAALEAEGDLKADVEAGIVTRKNAAKASVDAYKRLEPIRKNIANFSEGIALLREDGANTGVIDKYLPTFKEASLRLKNLQGRLGLDVLANTTFGALSASELTFALDTAVPEGMQPKALADWMEDRKEKQEILADHLEAAAMYLENHTIGEFIAKGKAEQKAREKQKAADTAKTGDTTPEQYKQLPSGATYTFGGKTFRKK